MRESAGSRSIRDLRLDLVVCHISGAFLAALPFIDWVQSNMYIEFLSLAQSAAIQNINAIEIMMARFIAM